MSVNCEDSRITYRWMSLDVDSPDFIRKESEFYLGVFLAQTFAFLLNRSNHGQYYLYQKSTAAEK